MSNDEVNLIKIYASYNQIEFILVKSVLESAGIAFLVKNEELQNTGLNLAFGPLEIFVNKNDVDQTKELIADVKS